MGGCTPTTPSFHMTATLSGLNDGPCVCHSPMKPVHGSGTSAGSRSQGLASSRAWTKIRQPSRLVLMGPTAAGMLSAPCIV